MVHFKLVYEVPEMSRRKKGGLGVRLPLGTAVEEKRMFNYTNIRYRSEPNLVP